MKTFWMLTYLDPNDRLVCEKYYDEDDAREAFYIAAQPLFLDEVRRLEARV